MDFEHTQLLAEVAQTNSQASSADSDDLVYTLSPAAFVRRYQYDVTDELQEAETAVLVWRDKEDDVMYQTLDDFDALLLETLADTPTSLNGLQIMLAEFMSSENGWQDALRQKWADWLEQGILVAASAEVV